MVLSRRAPRTRAYALQIRLAGYKASEGGRSPPPSSDRPVEEPMSTPIDARKDATPLTQAHNRAVLDTLPFGDTRDFEDARRGFLGTLPEVEIKNDQGRVVWSLGEYA